MLELGETLDTGGIQEMIDGVITYRVLDQGGITLEQSRLPKREFVHRRIFRHTEVRIY